MLGLQGKGESWNYLPSYTLKTDWFFTNNEHLLKKPTITSHQNVHKSIIKEEWEETLCLNHRLASQELFLLLKWQTVIHMKLCTFNISTSEVWKGSYSFMWRKVPKLFNLERWQHVEADTMYHNTIMYVVFF